MIRDQNVFPGANAYSCVVGFRYPYYLMVHIEKNHRMCRLWKNAHINFFWPCHNDLTQSV